MFRDVFGCFSTRFWKNLTSGANLEYLRPVERSKVDSRGRTWKLKGRMCYKGAKVEGTGAKVEFQRHLRPLTSYLRPPRTTFDPTLTKMRFLIQTKCFILEPC